MNLDVLAERFDAGHGRHAGTAARARAGARHERQIKVLARGDIAKS